jgi:uncharacterized protein involved in type VI secretion and phage assembly
MFDELLARLVEHVENRYYGKHRGFVTDNQDPDNLGRIKAKVPALLKDEETGWALPCVPYGGAAEQGFFAVPDVGAGVWIEFEGGDLAYPIWVGTWWSSGELPESATPDKKVIKTKSGNKIILDDSSGGQLIQVSDDAGNNLLKIDVQQGMITVQAGTKVTIEAPQIEIVKGASHPSVFGDSLLQYLSQLVTTYQSHTHPGQTAGPLPVSPMPPMPPAQPPSPSLLSTKILEG